MLTINIPEQEFYDEKSQMFFTSPGVLLLLEHSLASLSKWESIWCTPFLDGMSKTTEQTRSYVGCMNIAPVASADVYEKLTDANIVEISSYIESKQTATWFKADPNVRGSSEVITNEIIYYWMIAHTIPMEAQYWHLNRLLTLVKVCNEKNKPAAKSKMGTRDQATSRRMLNEQRKAQLNTSG